LKSCAGSIPAASISLRHLAQHIDDHSYAATRGLAH
jgi:hypothetical protein